MNDDNSGGCRGCCSCIGCIVVMLLVFVVVLTTFGGCIYAGHKAQLKAQHHIENQ